MSTTLPSRPLPAPKGRDSSPDEGPSEPVRKRAHRVSRACDLCHERSIRCRPSEDAASSSACQACFQAGRECTFNRPAKKRGVKAKPSGSSSVPRSLSRTVTRGPEPVSLRIPPFLTVDAIYAFIDVYYQLLYPCLPIFHRPTLLARVSRREYDTDRAFFGALMALCGLSCSRVRNPAFRALCWATDALRGAIQPAAFAQLAAAAVPKEPDASPNLDYLRCCVLMTKMALQENELRQANFYLGIYNTLWSLDNLHLEGNWPPSPTGPEFEERRRLFWSAYMLQVHTAICFGNSQITREAHTNIAYPRPFADEDVETDLQPLPHDGVLSDVHVAAQDGSSWIVGFNFLIDIFRALENALDRQKVQQRNGESVAYYRSVAQDLRSPFTFQDIAQKYSVLSPNLTETGPLPPMPKSNRYIITAVNIAASIQLLRILSCSLEEGTVQMCIGIAHEVHNTFVNIPSDAIVATGAQVLQQVASIGQVMAEKAGSGRGDETRVAMMALHSLLQPLELRTSGFEQASVKIRRWLEGNSAAT